MSTSKNKKSALKKRFRLPPIFPIGLAVLVLFLMAGLCQTTESAGLALVEVDHGGYNLAMPAASYQVHFPDSLDSPVRLTSGDRHYEFTLENMSYNAGDEYLGSPEPALAEINDETVIYPEVFEKVDVEYQLTSSGFKEFLVLNRIPPAPAGHLADPTLDFAQTIEAGGLRMYVDGVPAPDGFNTDRFIAFVDEADGETVFTLPAPYAVDAAGNQIPIQYQVQTRSDIFTIHTRTPYAWLADPDRAYPVRIDPSTTITADYSITLIDNFSWDSSFLGSGDWDEIYRSGIDFDTTVIPDTSTITKVELKIYIDDEYGPLGNDVGNMTKKAYTYHVTDNDKSGFWSDADGNQYLSNSSAFEGTGYHTVVLLSAAVTDLESQLGANWFSVGWSGTTEADKKGRDGRHYDEANSPQLIVTYTDACAGNSVTASPATVTEVKDGTCTVDKWDHISNATAQDDALADIDDKKFDTGDVSARLDLTNFSFDLPAGATIDGVKIEIDRSAENGAMQDEIVRLMINGSPDTTQNKALTSTAWPSSDTDTYQSYGGATDKWGISSLSESDVENSGFGATLCVEATDKKAAYVDHVQITVYYSTALTSVSNSPSPSTEGDASTHTIAFTTASALPADGKIVVTCPAGFNLLNVDNADISSGTMDGTFTVSRSGQELTITRSGGGSQSTGAENIIIADVDNTVTVGTSYTVDVETQTSCDVTIDGPTTSSAFTVKGNSALTNPATQVADQLTDADGTQPSDVELVSFKISPTGENLTWTDLVVSLTYGGGMADTDITNTEIYVDNGTKGTYESGTDTRVGAQSVNASGGSLTWNNVGGTVSAATDYLIIFDAGASLSKDETVQAAVSAANITVTGATSSQSITTTGDVTNGPLHTVAGNDPLTGVSNSPNPSTVSDTATHTVAFTTVATLPADGKIVVTFPAGFDLSAVGNADISSGTMDGSFTVSRSGQELTITRSGGSSQAAAAENIIIADITNTGTVGASYTVNVETQDSGGSGINGPTTSSNFTVKGKAALANPATQVTDKLTATDGTQPTDVALGGFKITPTDENLTWTGLVVSLTYGGGMADADITNAEIYVDNGTVGTYESGTDTQVGAQSVNAASGTLTWNTVGGTITAATDYLIIFDAGASLSENETVQASVTAANITVSGATSSQSITTSGDVTDEPLHTVTGCGDGQFSYRRTLVIDYTKVGTDNSGTLPSTGFPVLVSLSGDWLKTTTADPVNGRIANANGWDIVFRESDERTGLYHEIEAYDGTNGTLVARVRIDSLSKAADTTFYIYYGNACVDADPADADNVWDSSFEAVWHLVEEQSGTGNNDLYTDSTSNNYHGDDQISATGQEGKIADGQQFDGSNDYINLDGQGIEDHDYDAFTIEMWYKSSISLVTDDQYIYTHMDSAWSDYVTVGPTDDGTDDDKIRVSIGDGGTAGNVYGTTDVVDQQWHHLAMVRTGGGAGSRIKIYVDGNEETDAADPSGGGLIAMAASDEGPYIGDDPGNTEQVNGFLDEVRVSSVERDADWIKTEFNNQNNATPGAGNFIKSLGSEATAFSTAIDLLSLSATGSGSAVQVDWVTGSETGNLGFYLYRATSPYGPFVRITDQLIAGLNHSVENRAYSYTDANVTPGETYYYKLEDLDMDGRRTFHGPVGVNWDGAGAPEVTAGDPEPAPWEPGGAAGPVTVSASNEPVYKILVAREGFYRLSRDFLAGQGVALDKVDLSRVRLYHLGREVSIWVHDDNGDTVFDAADHITFYALPVAAEFAKYSTDNVYWLTTGAGENTVKRMAAVDSAADDSALATGFDATVRSEQDQYYYPNAPGCR